MGDAAKVIMVTPDELEQLVRKAVRSELAREATPTESDLLTTLEAAAYCKMGKRTLLWHVGEGRLVPDSPARKGFKVHRFRRATLDRFLVSL